MALKFRRGTTAQQSGSLAFGEPYVNTTLGTLLVGGPTGDIVLSTAGTGSTGTFGPISGSGLDITGNANIAGDLTVGGQLTIGDQTSDTINVVASLSSSLIPSDDNSFDIGSTSKRYKNIYAQNISASVLSNVTGSVNKLAYFIEKNKVVSYSNSHLTQNTFGIGTSATSSAPERLMVDNSGIDSYNIATFQTSQQNSYAEVNIKNFGSGSTSSTDLVIWNDESTEGSGYLDLGMNSSNYTAGFVGYENDSYLFTSANDLYIGANTTGSHGHLHLFAGGKWNESAISVYTDGTIGINTDKLDNNAASIPTAGFVMEISGAVKFNNAIDVTGGIIGSIQATNGIVSGSSQVIGILSSLNTFSGSQLTQNSTLATITGSLIDSASTAKSTNDTQNGRLSNLESTSASVNISVTKLNTYTSSLNNAIQLTGSTVSFLGDIVVYGTQSIINSTNLAVSDNLIYLNEGSTVTNPDLGIVGNYNDGTYAHSGIFRDASDGGAWKVFKGYTLEPSGTIDTAGNGFALADFKADVITATSFNGTINSTNGVVSGSSQVIGILSSLNTYTGSNDTTNTTQNTRLTALEASASTALSTNNTQDTSISNLNSTTASLNTSVSNLNSFSASALTRLSNLEGKDISITLTGDVTGTGTITDLANVSFATTIAANSVALGTDTTGDYVASLVAGTGVTLSNNSGESATPTIAIGQAVASGSNVQFNSLGVGMAASATAGRIDAANDIVAFSSSDIRFKENIKPIENALDKISKISGNTYDWKEENKIEHGYEGNDVGVIAQEIEAVLPQLVQNRDNGYKAVKYDKLVALLIEGIKEQQTQIHSLTLEIEKLKESKGL